VAGIAAVAAMAVAVTAIRTSGNGNAAKPHLPAGHVSTSAASTSAADIAAPSTTAPARRPAAGAPSTRPGQPTQAQPVLLKHGAQQGRAQVPWSQVGPGWYLALTDSTPRALYLINPVGGRYLITDHLPNAEDRISAWSPDGKRVMLIREKGTARIITELELATGRTLHTVDLGERGFLGYTRPQGRAILVTGSAGAATTLERLAVDGNHQLTYPQTVPGFGQLGFPVLYSADGTQLVVGGHHGIALLGNDGRLIRALPAPAGAQGCWPARWWNTATVLETCDVRSGVAYELLLQPVAGGQPEKVAGASKAYPLGFVNAWRYSEGTLLTEGAGCGPGRLDVLRDGVIRRLTLPAGVPDSPPVIGVAGDVITLRRAGGCPASQDSVISFNLVTGATTTLLTGNAGLVAYPWQ
jgi:TolB protein